VPTPMLPHDLFINGGDEISTALTASVWAIVLLILRSVFQLLCSAAGHRPQICSEQQQWACALAQGV
jgi:hypothetical protein